jgi:hypothetical protein
LLAVTAVFAIGLAIERRLPRIHPIAATTSLLLLAQGWIMTWNPRSFFHYHSGTFIDIAQRIRWLPGSVHQLDSMPQMLLVTGLIGAMWICADLQHNAQWRNRVWTTMALTGFSIVLLGIAQHITGASAILWEWGHTTGRTFFATYRYHANAGAFVNLILPLIAGKAFLAFRFREGQATRTLWLVATLLTTACVFVHASRAASAIGVLLILSMTVWLATLVMKSRPAPLQVVAFGVAAFAVVGGLAWAIGFEKLTHAFGSKGTLIGSQRYFAYTAILQGMIPDTGACGFGPGTFPVTFPLYRHVVGIALRGFWMMAHQDYLQTLVEWGWVGAILWAILVPGALLKGIITTASLPPKTSPAILVLTAIPCFSLAGILVHAMIDFPLQIASLQLYTACLVGILWRCRNIAPGDSQRRAP